MRSHPQSKTWLTSVFVTLAAGIALLSGCAPAAANQTPLPAPTVTGISSTAATTPAPAEVSTVINAEGTIILSMNEGGFSHLFAYTPKTQSLLRLTNNLWNDTQPALSPDGRTLVFASDRSEYWDIYLLDLFTGQISRVTDTPTYDSAPQFSPDGQWIVYETFVDNQLDLVIKPLTDPNAEVISLAPHPAADHSPAWSPKGRQIAFVSTRAGKNQVWMIDLDRTDADRTSNIGKLVDGQQNNPAWSPNGRYLVFDVNAFGSTLSGIYIWDSENPNISPRWIGSGAQPAWNADGSQITAAIATANQTFLTAYAFPSGSLTLALTPLPGNLRGMVWPPSIFSDALPESFQAAANATPTALWSLAVTPVGEGPQRWSMATLDEVQAPTARLHDLVDEAFSALRQRTIAEAGWDALANLQFAFTPLTTPLDPGKEQDWLYTGRAFSVNPIILNAGWMVAIREDFNQQTYWQIYLRAQAQDGSMGEPLHALPWDLSARYALNPLAYEQGGQLMDAMPGGYWVHFTELAQVYGWERLPALPNWRTFFNGSRATEFVMTNGLDWHSAMLEIYPADIFVTPTVVIPPTKTPTRTQRWVRTPTPTFTPTPRPTFTPSP